MSSENIASWEKHTKGIGSKLLQKFGFKGRLGANEDGIAKAIEVNVRPVNVGLGFGDVDAPKVEDDHHIFGKATSSKSKDAAPKRKQSAMEIAASSESWKKAKYEKEEKKKELDIILNEYASFAEKSAGKVASIIDMRHKNIKVITNLTDISQTEVQPDDVVDSSSTPLGAELLFNLNKIAEQEKRHVVQISRRIADERKIRDGHVDQIKSIESRIMSDKKHLSRFNHMISLLQQLQSVSSAISSIPLLDAASMTDSMGRVRRLIEDFHGFGPLEFKVYGVMQLLPTILGSFIRHIPPCDLGQQVLHLRTLNENWQVLVSFFVAREERSYAVECEHIFFSAVEGILLPSTYRYIASTWQPEYECDFMVNLVEVLQNSLPNLAAKALVEEHILPRLITAIQNSSDRDSPLIHTYVLPWLPLLKERLQVVYPEVRRKIAIQLRSWQPKETNMVKVLLPWKVVFDGGSYDNLISRIVVPKLVDYLREEVVINPANQQIESFEHVLLWTPALTTWQLDCLFSGEFFPKFIGVLHTWLSLPDPEYSEISEWYSGWKSIFPPDLTQEGTLVSKALRLALDLMETRLAADDEKVFALQSRPVLEAMQHNNYYILAKQFLDQKESRGSHGRSISTSRNLSESATLKEVLELLAEQNGLTFAPKFGKSVQGKPIWQFGKSQCYLTNDIVYMQQKVSEKVQWVPVSFEDLLRISH